MIEWTLSRYGGQLRLVDPDGATLAACAVTDGPMGAPTNEHRTPALRVVDYVNVARYPSIVWLP